MAEVRRQFLTGDTSLDSNTYGERQFNDACLTYGGDLPPLFDKCGFNTATFDGATGRTAGFLRAMSPTRTNMAPIVGGLPPELGLTN